MNRRRLGWIVVFLAATMIMSACGGGARGGRGGASGGGTSFTMKVGNDTAQDIQEEITYEFARLVTEESGGRIQATAHSAGTIGNNAELASGLQSGSVEAMVSPTGFVTQYIPELGALDLPFALPPDVADMTEAVKGKAGQKLRELAAEKGFRIVALFGIGSTNYYTNYPVNTAEDIKGKKFRVIPSPERIGAYKSWGALGVGMQFGEIYTSLQQNTIQGLEIPPDISLKSKLYEVAPYYTLSGHSVLVELIAVSQKWYDSLPKDLQEAVDRAGQKAEAFGVARYTEGQAQAVAEFKKLENVTVKELPPAEIEKLKQMAMDGVWKEIQEDPVKGPIVKLLLEDLQGR